MRTIHFLSLAHVLIAIFSYIFPHGAISSPMKISGKLIGAEKSTLKIQLEDQFPHIDHTVYKIPINDDGSFSWEIQIPYTMDGFLVWKTETEEHVLNVFLRQDEDLEIYAEAENFSKSIKFGGSLAHIQQYLYEDIVDMFKGSVKRPQSPTSEMFYDFQLKLIQSRLIFLESFHKRDPLPSDFYQRQKRNIIFNHSFFNYKKIRELNDQDPYWRFYQEIPINQNEVFGNRSYASYLHEYLICEYRKRARKRGLVLAEMQMYDSLYIPTLLQIVQDSLKGESHIWGTAWALETGFKVGSPNLQDLYIEYRQYVKNKYLLEKLDVQLAAYKQGLKGRLPQKANILQSEPLTSVSQLDNILTKYTGKVILIDLWASWCGPCKTNFPIHTQLKEKLKDENIVYLYLAFDPNPDVWLKDINQYKLKGDHVRISDEFIKSFKIKYPYRGLPTTILLNNKGEVVSYRGTIDLEMEKEIRKLLED